MLFKKKQVAKQKINKKSELIDFSVLLLGATFTALSFNLFLLPNNIVFGLSGLSIITNKLWGIKPSIFILVISILLLILSYLFLGKEVTKRSCIGSILYPLLVELTSYLIPFISFNGIDNIILILCGGLLTGFGSGLVYKVNYSTGGSDVANQLLSKYLKRPIGTSVMITNGVIIAIGFLVFGLQTVIYSVIIVYISSIIIDKVMIGISESKTFQIITENETDVKRFLLSKLSHGVTVIEARGGYTGNRIKVIMCVVPTREYVVVKEGILNIDSSALIMVSDVYEVIGNK